MRRFIDMENYPRKSHFEFFGKYIKEDDRTRMPLHIQCKHALVDGYHLSEFYQIFQELADKL